MRALFVGGTVDNSELDMTREVPPAHYPENTGAGIARYNLHHVGVDRDDCICYAVYAAPDLADEVVRRISEERDYPRRFDARPAPPPGGLQ
jgi:hypothetical protein